MTKRWPSEIRSISIAIASIPCSSRCSVLADGAEVGLELHGARVEHLKLGLQSGLCFVGNASQLLDDFVSPFGNAGELVRDLTAPREQRQHLLVGRWDVEDVRAAVGADHGDALWLRLHHYVRA